MCKNFIFFLFSCYFILCGQKSTAQGSGLLIQQYGKSNLDEFGLRKWNYDAHLLLNRFNTTDRETKGKIGFSAGGSVRYNFKKSYGLRTGIDIHSINYAYDLANDTSKDQLLFLSIPLTGRLYPVKRVTLELGLVYNFLLKTKGDPPTNLEEFPVTYPEGTFSNSFGVLAAVHYTFWKRFSASIQYQFQKNNTNPVQRETNGFAGFMLGFHYTFLTPKIPVN
ncbi:PorT family protein [Flavobacteriaceae bacterium]|nr:PorT family protein [Flavobacteriaceae bacterium]MDC1460837.1 PorT family protein [Flavobacteriaceae bacterium]